MGTSGTIEVIAPIVAVGIGVGLMKRSRVAIGVMLVAAGVGAVVVLAVSGKAKPIVGMIAMIGLIGGLIADEKGHRPLGLAGIAVGMFALFIAYFHT
jgi:hypothetical protein